MTNRKLTRGAAAFFLAGGMLAALCCCTGRTASNMQPRGETVEVTPVAPAPADTLIVNTPQ